jgi:hypothetical protein
VIMLLTLRERALQLRSLPIGVATMLLWRFGSELNAAVRLGYDLDLQHQQRPDAIADAIQDVVKQIPSGSN